MPASAITSASGTPRPMPSARRASASRLPPRAVRCACARRRSAVRAGRAERMAEARPMTPEHIPVLLAEVLAALAPRDGGRYLDGTFGRGGYARALLAAADTRVLGLDRDPAAVAEGRRLEAELPGRFVMCQGRFGDMERLAEEAGFRPLDGIALDLGVSSPQIDEPERGFSFRSDGPLDMRMGAAAEGTPSAAELVNGESEAALADIIFHLGEERR